MNSLEMTDEKAAKISDAEDKALDVLVSAMDGGEVGDEARLAVKVVNMAAKNRQTLTAREAVRFNMATVGLDEKQLKNYVKATNPQIQKALGK